jgi:hypothetical protein
MGNIKINVSGSGASFGNVVQGSHNRIHSQHETNDSLVAVREAAEKRAGEAGVGPEQLAALLNAIESLKARVDSGESENDLTTRLRDLAKSFAWAVPVLKLFAEKLLPKIATIVFG